MAKLRYRTISKRTVDRLSVDDKDAVFWDRELPGFGVRVYPSGSKVYVVQTRSKGKSKRVTLGRHGVISADQARRKAAETIACIKSGEDPEGKPASTVTVADVAARYLKEHVALHCKPSMATLYRSVVGRFILPAYGHLSVEEVGRISSLFFPGIGEQSRKYVALYSISVTSSAATTLCVRHLWTKTSLHMRQDLLDSVRPAVRLLPSAIVPAQSVQQCRQRKQIRNTKLRPVRGKPTSAISGRELRNGVRHPVTPEDGGAGETVR